MGFFDGFAEGIASAVDNIRHEFENSAYGRQTTDDLVLPQVQAPTIEAPSSGVIDLTSPNSDPSWGVALDSTMPQQQEAPASYQELMRQDIGKIEPPAPSQEMER